MDGLKTLAVCCAALLALPAAPAVEPRDYATYDLMGMVPYEDVKEPTPLVKKAAAEERAGRYKAAEALYRKAFYADIYDLQAIVGYAKCARRQGEEYASGIEQQMRKQMRKDPTFNYTDDFGRSVDRKKESVVMLLWALLNLSDKEPYYACSFTYMHSAYRASNHGFVPTLYVWSFGTRTPTEEREMFEVLHKKYPKVEGFDYYRILSHVNGNYGMILYDTKRKKFRSVGSPSDRPQCEKAYRELQPYLQRKDVPTWVYFLAARASSGIGRKDLASKYARLVADAKGDSKLLRDWKERIKRSGYLK